MDDAQRIEIEGVAQMRAVAHPTRMRLLGLLRMHGAATAAMLGPQVGEAPGTVSYHLRTLAAAGFIEPAEGGGDRRERWWRASHTVTSWDPVGALDDPASAEAVAALQRTVGAVYAQRWAEYVDAVPMRRDWVAAASSGDALLRLTVGELAELRDELTRLTERWQQRSDSREADGDARLVALVTQAYRVPA